MANPSSPFEKPLKQIGQAIAHESAVMHVTGEARYLDDIELPANTLELYVFYSPVAHGSVRSLDLAPVLASPGRPFVISADDISGSNDVSPVGAGDEPLFATSRVDYAGQPLFAVGAADRITAKRAAHQALLEIDPIEPVLDPVKARARESFVWPPSLIERGDVEKALDRAIRRLRGTVHMGAQDHFYLEGHCAIAMPQEDGGLKVLSSTQHPSEVQHMVARVLGLADHAVKVEVRRMGGGFGGKETQASQFAAMAALMAVKSGRTVKCVLDRDDDMLITGKRHPFRADYDVAFNEVGVLDGVWMEFTSSCGFSADLSGPVNDRALLHADNAYFYPHVELTSYPARTNIQSSTAFRGFGGPQGMLAAERMMEEIAWTVGRDPLEVRKANFYDRQERRLTPYHQAVEDNVLLELVESLEAQSEYWRRRPKIKAFNRANKWIRRGLALTPVKFGISFTHTAYNQAGALLHIYKDGSILLNHGGTEMGQGLHTKVSQIVAQELMVDQKKIRISATNTSKVPNTSATAASAGTDLNGMAALSAAQILKNRLTAFAAARDQIDPKRIIWVQGGIRAGDKEQSFEELIHDAYMARVQLSAEGFYKTPDIEWNREEGRGRPFYYFAYGAAVSEVTVDCITGEYRVDRVDILHDVGRSINPAIDLGQIEGGFIQGMGWLTTEEVWWNEKGVLKTHAPSTYKIPTSCDRPLEMNIEIFKSGINREPTVHRSKAVGEPPLMLAISVLSALNDAVASIGQYKIMPRIDAPATPERVFNAVHRVRREADLVLDD